MKARSPASMRTVATTLLAVVVAAGGCSEILGLEDPAGRLGEGGGAATTGGPGSASTDAASSGSSAGAGQGGAPGVGGGSSTGGSTSSTGAGGAPASSGALELPDDVVVHALGTSDEGAVALVRWSGADGDLCSSPVPAGHLAVASITGAQCEVLTTISGPSPTGVTIEQRGPWLGLIVRAQPGTVTVHTGAAPIDGESIGDDGGMYGVWNLGDPATGYLIPTVAALASGHITPAADGSTLMVQNAQRFGFTPSLGASGEPCETAPAETGLQVHFLATEIGGEGCVRPREQLAGTLLDVGTGTHTWALVTAGNCVALRVDDDEPPTRTFGACEPFAHLHVEPDGGDDRLFVGSSSAGPCGEEGPRAGLVAHIDGQARPLWCDDGVSTTRVIPFLADATHVHFVRVIGSGAELWKVRIDDGVADPARTLCTSCNVRDAVASNGTVYLMGETSAPTELLGEAIAGSRAFWAWIPLADL